MDIVGALSGLVIILPAAPLIALAIVAESRGGVLVRLERISEGSKEPWLDDDFQINILNRHLDCENKQAAKRTFTD